MQRLELEQNSPEWEEFRRTHIGASDSPIICGVSPYKTAYKLWKEKVTGEKDPTNQAMQDGHDLEGDARKWAESIYMSSLAPACVLHESLPYFMASLDAYNELDDLIVEIKVVGDNTFFNAEANGPPKSWIYQVNHQMECTKIDEAYIFMMHRSKDKYCNFRVDRDMAIVAEILEKGEEFYVRMMNFDPPEDSHKQREDDEWRGAAERFLEAKNAVAEAEEYLNMCRAQLIEITGNESCRGHGVSATKYIAKGHIDYSKVPEIKGVDLSKYRKPPKETWRVA